MLKDLSIPLSNLRHNTQQGESQNFNIYSNNFLLNKSFQQQANVINKQASPLSSGDQNKYQVRSISNKNTNLSKEQQAKHTYNGVSHFNNTTSVNDTVINNNTNNNNTSSLSMNCNSNTNFNLNSQGFIIILEKN